ncbi:MAG: hypothetical protein WDZ94_01040 [Patescibacteria group bacterium]
MTRLGIITFSLIGFLIAVISGYFFYQQFFSETRSQVIATFYPTNQSMSFDQSVFTNPTLFLKLENSTLLSKPIYVTIFHLTEEVDESQLIQKTIGNYPTFNTEERELVSALSFEQSEKNTQLNLYIHEELEGDTQLGVINHAFIVGILTIIEANKVEQDVSYRANYAVLKQEAIDIMDQLYEAGNDRFIRFSKQ